MHAQVEVHPGPLGVLLLASGRLVGGRPKRPQHALRQQPQEGPGIVQVLVFASGIDSIYSRGGRGFRGSWRGINMGSGVFFFLSLQQEEVVMTRPSDCVALACSNGNLRVRRELPDVIELGGQLVRGRPYAPHAPFRLGRLG